MTFYNREYQEAHSRGYCEGRLDAKAEIREYREKLIFLAELLSITSDWIDEVEVEDMWIRLTEESESIYKLLLEKHK